MDKSYWNKVSDDYDSAVFSVIKQDHSQVVLKALDQYGQPDMLVSDVGAGVGNFLPELSNRFKRVLAIDISWKCLAQAQSKCADYQNIDYIVADVGTGTYQAPKVDLTLCVNALITDSLVARCRMIEQTCKNIKRGGYLLLVVPSVESMLLTNARLIELNVKTGVPFHSAHRSGFSYEVASKNERMHEGIIKLDGVPTKHYIKEELELFVHNHGMSIIESKKVPYSWETEFDDPPAWMKDPYPWDWLCIAQKN